MAVLTCSPVSSSFKALCCLWSCLFVPENIHTTEGNHSICSDPAQVLAQASSGILPTCSSSFAAISASLLMPPADVSLHLSHHWTSSEDTVLCLCFYCLVSVPKGTLHLLSSLAGETEATHSANKKPENADMQAATFHLLVQPILPHFRLHMTPSETGFRKANQVYWMQVVCVNTLMHHY